LAHPLTPSRPLPSPLPPPPPPPHRYNAVNGIPTCASPFLTTVLRDTWQFAGYVTSDSGALEDIYDNHHYTNDSLHTVYPALHDGRTDVCSGGVYTSSLLPALQAGLVSRDDVSLALYDTFLVRFQLGLFDPADNQPYWHVPLSSVGSQSSDDTAMLATLEGQVLLHNDGNILPLAKGQKIALIGPHANATGALVGNYLGQLCPDDTFDCIYSPYGVISQTNNAAGGSTVMSPGCQLTKNDTSGFAAAVAAAQAADVVVLFLGIDLTVEGEANDRTSIDLPAIQHQLAAAIAAVGKPTAVVLINGGMVDVSEEVANKNIGAILEVGYPGMRGSYGISATLFGDNDHLGGKLPYTIYPANYVNQINMSVMELDVGPGRTYRYYSGPVVYPFGYGISLTTFSVDPFTAAAPFPHAAAEPGVVYPAVPATAPAALTTTYYTTADALEVVFTRPYVAPVRSKVADYAVNVTNTGSRTGDEVVQAYFMPLSTPLLGTTSLIRQLFDYQRVHLAPGQSQLVSFASSADTFVMVDKATGDRVSTPGVFDVVLTDGVHKDRDIIHRVVIGGAQRVVEPFPGK
jgi:xylan 1,4-beta-xylosidase